MAARGSLSKEIITQKLLSTFDGAFIYGKEIRIPMDEGGDLVQIKVTLTAAKENVESGADTATPTATISIPTGTFEPMTEQEKADVRAKIAELNL